MRFRLGMRAAALALGAALLLPAAASYAATAYTATDADTFWSLSKKFDVPLEKLMSFNTNVDPKNIYAGLKLSIPAPTTAAVTAKSVQSAAVLQSAKIVKTTSGDSLSYATAIQMKATAYSAAIEENAWGPVDYFGNALKLGTIAVDPKVIPLGTKVYITGYNADGLPVGGMYAVARDTGSAIKGNRIDIFVPGSRDKASSFGIQYVNLYVLN
ncbi:3D domain-containing protein [Cohnella hashimotonis]|uniref:3D domain-containing protein n=1 Tax=Cohnella hashimotonis TaxID=2826895 RepID=A0ABT6TBX7_9BACL|nr:3D domain-containing protein [Cohnella hashimotonis]MDI4644347.1 3D domain-containing protein [Cohnella hashimotonis]